MTEELLDAPFVQRQQTDKTIQNTIDRESNSHLKYTLTEAGKSEPKRQVGNIYFFTDLENINEVNEAQSKVMKQITELKNSEKALQIKLTEVNVERDRLAKEV